jgi:hypothetical protein
MTTCRTAVALLLAMAAGAGAAADQPAAAPVAIVVSASGTITRATPETGAQAVRRFDRLGPGTLLETGADGVLQVVFRSGVRARLAPSSRARIEAARMVALGGTVEALASVPVLPTVAAVPQAGTAVAAVRVRAGALALHRPAVGQVTLADATVLSGEAAPADEYDVEVEDDAAQVVFRSRASAPRVEVPHGTLAPGHTYRWRMRATAPSGFSAEGRGHFSTLPTAAAEARATLRGALGDADPSSVALLAELDFALGLWSEALDGFRAARRRGVADAVVDARIADLATRLGDALDPPRR